jgi:hypothetical protein
MGARQLAHSKGKYKRGVNEQAEEDNEEDNSA